MKKSPVTIECESIGMTISISDPSRIKKSRVKIFHWCPSMRWSNSPYKKYISCYTTMENVRPYHGSMLAYEIHTLRHLFFGIYVLVGIKKFLTDHEGRVGEW